MNRQPYAVPPQSWPPLMNSALVASYRAHNNHTLQAAQKIRQIEVQGAHHVETALAAGNGILIAPNHSFHYDSSVLIEVGQRCGRPFHFLTAWQVFAMSTPFEQWLLQIHGCYSINREANDHTAFKQSVKILHEGAHPLVIFPEGDIYHGNDRLRPFREGAAAIAISAAKKGMRRVVAIPCALKVFYTSDPTAELDEILQRIEAALKCTPPDNLSRHDRVLRCLICLVERKEIAVYGKTQSGIFQERKNQLIETLLSRHEQHWNLPRSGDHVERVKEIRKAAIAEQVSTATTSDEVSRAALDDAYFAMQLFSYADDYLSSEASIERLAETIDKLEEDVLLAELPAARGERRVIVRFGEPILISPAVDHRVAITKYSQQLHGAVQHMLDQINADQAAGSMVTSIGST